VLLTTNLPFSEWTQVIPNARLCKAVLDRITDRAHIIETGADSFRFKRTLAQRQRKGSGNDEHPRYVTMAGERSPARARCVETALFRTVGVAFATTRVAKQRGASDIRRPPCRCFRAASHARASSTSARSARRASWANKDATNASGFVVG
jgi:hypothetical protein